MLAWWIGIYTVADGLVTKRRLGWSGPGAPAHPVFAATKGLTGHAVRAGAMAVSNNVAAEPRYLTNQEDSGSELIVPVPVWERSSARWMWSVLVGAFGGEEILHDGHLAGRGNSTTVDLDGMGIGGAEPHWILAAQLHDHAPAIERKVSQAPLVKGVRAPGRLAALRTCPRRCQRTSANPQDLL
jgi:hypothetical protein